MPNDLPNFSTRELEQELTKRKIVEKANQLLESEPLKMTQVTHYEVNSSDFEAFILRIFGKEYESAVVEESCNDTCKIYNNIYGSDVSYHDEVESFLYGVHSVGPDLRALLNYLVNKHFIIGGNFTFKWSW